LRSFGARAASSSTVSFTYLQAVVVPTPEPGGQLGERLAFPQVSQDQQGCLPGFSFRQHDPISFRWRRMIPAA